MGRAGARAVASGVARSWIALGWIALSWITGCGREPEPQPLPPAETFHWVEQPISFSPPPEGWRREGYDQGGLIGVMFIKTGSVGEGITVAVHSSNEDRPLRDRIEPHVFRPERHSEPDSFLATMRRDTTVAGHEAVLTDYELHGPERVYRGREIWLAENRRLFTARYIGLEENLPLFDRIASTIVFPPPKPGAAP